MVELTGDIVKLPTLPGGSIPVPFDSSVKVVAGARYSFGSRRPQYGFRFSKPFFLWLMKRGSAGLWAASLEFELPPEGPSGTLFAAFREHANLPSVASLYAPRRSGKAKADKAKHAEERKLDEKGERRARGSRRSGSGEGLARSMDFLRRTCH